MVLKTRSRISAIGVGLVCAGVGSLVTGSAQAADELFAYVPCAWEDNVYVVDMQTNEVIDVITVAMGPNAVNWKPDGTEVWVCNNGAQGEGTTVSVIDPATNTVTHTIDLPHAGPEGARFSPDGSMFYTTAANFHQLPPDGVNDYIIAIDTSTYEVTNVLEVGEHPWDLTVHPDGSKLYIANAHDETLMVVDAATFQVLDTNLIGDGWDYGWDHHPAIVEITPDGQHLWVMHMHGDIATIHDLETLEIIHTIDFQDPDCAGIEKCEHAMGLEFHPTQRVAFVGRYNRDEVSLYDMDTFEEIDRIVTGDGPKTMGITPDGRYLYVGDFFAQQLEVYDLIDNSLVTTIAVGQRPLLFGNFMGPPLNVPDCPWDMDSDGQVGTTDLLTMLGFWGQKVEGPPDFNEDGVVDGADLVVLLGNWGACP